MSAYSAIRLAAFQPARTAPPFIQQLYGLAFPAHWRQKFLDFYRLGKRNPETYSQVPIRRLNELIRAVAPDLLCVARGATLEDDAPWLYARKPFPLPVLCTFINAWIRDLHSAKERAKHPELVEAAIVLGETLDTHELRWQKIDVDLLSRTSTPGGTAEPDPRLYQLLPDTLAHQIAALDPYRFEGVEMQFRIAAAARGAELVSWPPREFLGEEGTWRFSFVVALTVQTAPFTDDFRVHLRTGVRRWRTSGLVKVPFQGAVSAYMLADMPWLNEAPGSARLSVSRFGKSRGSDDYQWVRGGPEGMIGRLRFARDLPDPGKLQSDPGAWIDGKDGIQVGVVHSTSMGGHGVGAGLMPRDRSPLTDWAAVALEPRLRRVPDHGRSRYPVVPRNLPKDPQGKTKEARAAHKSILKREQQDSLRKQVVRTLGDAPLIAEIRWQNPRTRDALIATLAELLGLDGDGGEGAVRSWDSPELAVRLHIEDAGLVSAPLAFPGPKPQRKHLAEAITDRRTAIASMCDLDQRDPGQLTIIEIGHADSYRPSILDPKFAARLGYADAGRLTQFINLPSAARKTAGAKNIAHRAEASWKDAFRQLGVRTVPEHSLTGLPDDLQYVGLWMIKRRADGPTRKRRTAPVAVKISADGNITGWDPESGTWVPYREVLLALARHAEIPGEFDEDDVTEETPVTADAATQQNNGKREWSPDLEDQQAEAAQFIRAMLYSLRNEPTLLLTHAQNSRLHWPWLRNGSLRQDMLQFGPSPAQRIDLYGDMLRHVRVRDSGMDETPQWFAPDDETHVHGIASGLWTRPDSPDGFRVFLSTAEKPDTAKRAAVTASKIATRMDKKGEEVTDTGQNAWNPTALELAVLACQTHAAESDDPEQWAALAHQLRRAPDYRATLVLPLPLHLAKLTAQWA
ncbi:pPIWI_RE module domain-containing protein [Kitasatospora sp. NPDC001175]|uniref:pPIWI_RE module domain-containing protein n=1 Tax=Kitasatospora sp. NPDC001175 TaxID=3157103 RepID=UPI003D056F59